MRTLGPTVVVLLTVAAALGADRGDAPPPKDTGQPALVAIIGRDGKIMAPEFRRIMDSAEWLEVWARHVGKQKKDVEWSGPYPKIDFTRCMVIAFFRGKTVNTRGEELQALDEVDGRLRVRFRSSGYQSMSFEGEDLGEPAISYGIWVLPRSTKGVVIEEDVQNLLNKPPIWKEQVNFEAVKE